MGAKTREELAKEIALLQAEHDEIEPDEIEEAADEIEVRIAHLRGDAAKRYLRSLGLTEDEIKRTAGKITTAVKTEGATGPTGPAEEEKVTSEGIVDEKIDGPTGADHKDPPPESSRRKFFE